MVPVDRYEDCLAQRAICTTQILENPYDFSRYLQRAECYEKLGYPDLAAGDAYRGLLLTDEIEDGEYGSQACEAIWSRREDLNETISTLSKNGHSKSSWISSAARMSAIRAYAILSRSLTACADVKNAFDFIERGTRTYPEEQILHEIRSQIIGPYDRDIHGRHTNNSPTIEKENEFPGTGSVRREIYPWNHHEPDRCSEETLTSLGSEMQKCASKCEIRTVQLLVLTDGSLCESSSDRDDRVSKLPTVKQLGLFATEDIEPFETVLLEPSILTANNRLHEPLCDACSATLPAIQPSSPIPTCVDCTDIYFCSNICHDRAQETYHPAVCGIDDYDIVAKDPSPAAATDALYLLLVARTIAMAETQEKHPLDLPQIKFIWGDFTPCSNPVKRNLPFNFQTNIAHPIHILMNMGIDPFAATTVKRYDTWVLNTLFAKFRGVASAKMNPHTLRPDVAAVHPLWSMANHSCAPNVRWEWGAEDGNLRGKEKGAMGFAARGGREVVQWGVKERDGGIKMGEEVLSHYCDVGMDVKERREWAIGALGGVCQCSRCIWEENHTRERLGTDGESSTKEHQETGPIVTEP